MKSYRLELVRDYSRLDHDANWLLSKEPKEFKTLRKARLALRAINLKLGARLGKADFLPRIDILDNEGKRYKWGEL